MLEREYDELSSKSTAIHQVWKDLQDGQDWEEDVMEAQVKDLKEEQDELRSRQDRLQDLIDRAAGVAPARREKAIFDCKDSSAESKKPSGVDFLLKHETYEAAYIIEDNASSRIALSDADITSLMHELLNLAVGL